MLFSSAGCHVYGSRSLQVIIILTQWLGSAGNVRPVSSILLEEFDVLSMGIWASVIWRNANPEKALRAWGTGHETVCPITCPLGDPGG
jgi:hypothetical protein